MLRRFAAFWGLMLLACVATAQTKPEPLDLIREAFGRQFSVRGTYLQERRQLDEQSPMLLKINVGFDGQMRMLVLQPMSMQGIVSSDDGREWRTYLPDAREVRVQVSPRVFATEPNKRAQIIDRNYTLRFEATETVAGRSTRVVLAIPRDREMYVRRLFVDAQHRTILRYEIDVQKGQTVRTLDTKSVEFAPKVRVEAAELAPPARIVRMFGPKSIEEPDRVVGQVGFEPRLVTDLPAGFQVQAVQLIGTAERPFVGIRLTDGLATATLYQWLGSRFREKPPVSEVPATWDQHGVAYALVGDVPPSVAKRLIGSFLDSVGGRSR